MKSLNPGRQGEQRRCRVVHFDVYALLYLLQQCATGTFTVENPLPVDARVVGVQENWYRNTVDLLVWSAEFAIVPDDQTPPDHEIRLTWHAFAEDSEL